MSSKNAIGSLLHSLSTQLNETLSTADADGDGKISAEEAKALAPEFRDNFERYQEAHPGEVSAPSFAHSFMAYAAISLRHADANGSGILSAHERKSLRPDLADNLRAISASTRQHGGFLGGGEGTPVALAGVKATQLPVSASTQALEKALTLHPDWPFFATGFQLEPAALKAVMADPAQQKAFLNAALFQATGTDYATKYPDYYSADRLEVTPSAGAAAGASYLLGKLTDLGAFGQGGADRSSVAGELGAITGGLFEAGAGQSFALTWTNHDDAQFHALVSVNEATGQVRVAGFYPVP